MTLAEKLRKLVQEQGVDLKQVATKAGMSYHTVRSYAQGRADKFPSVRNGIALARALNVDIQWLYDDSKEWPPVRYHEAPPFTIRPWPPDRITFEEVCLALAAYVKKRDTEFLAKLKRDLEADGIDPVAWMEGRYLDAIGEPSQAKDEQAPETPHEPDTP